MVCETTCDISVFSVSTMAASPATVMVSLVNCTDNWMFTVRVWPTCRLSPVRTVLAKPVLLTVISYEPGCRNCATKMPASLLARARSVCVATFFTVTAASVTTAPLESVTVPVIVPAPVVCAAISIAMQALKIMTLTIWRMLSIRLSSTRGGSFSKCKRGSYLVPTRPCIKTVADAPACRQSKFVIDSMNFCGQGFSETEAALPRDEGDQLGLDGMELPALAERRASGVCWLRCCW